MPKVSFTVTGSVDKDVPESGNRLSSVHPPKAKQAMHIEAIVFFIMIISVIFCYHTITYEASRTQRTEAVIFLSYGDSTNLVVTVSPV